MRHDVKTSEYIQRLLSKPLRALYSVRQKSNYDKIMPSKDGFYHVKYRGKNILLEKIAQPFEIYEQFTKPNPYDRLTVKGKVVIDIGGGVADTAIIFCINGAKEVYAFEPDKKRYEAGLKNIKMNKIPHITLIRTAINNLDEVNKHYKGKNLVLKSDCEGAEHDIFKNSSKTALKNYDEVIMEFHNGYLDLKEILENSGFTVSYSFSPYYSADFNGILYAYRSDGKKKG